MAVELTPRQNIIRRKITGTYIFMVIIMVVLLVVTFALLSIFTIALIVFAWILYVSMSKSESDLNLKDIEFCDSFFVFKMLREYLSLRLHRTERVRTLLHPKKQAIFALSPHGVGCEFHMLLGAPLQSAFPQIPVRSLVAAILFKIPVVRTIALKIGSIDASRKTASKCLESGMSLTVVPGGLVEQVDTIYGRDRVHISKQFGFIRLALVHDVPIVPVFVFGSSDLYFTTRWFHSAITWVAKNLGIALPLHYGHWGMLLFPNPKGFPLPVEQNLVFGDPLYFPKVKVNQKPTRKEIGEAHAVYVDALRTLYDTHKKNYGCGNRSIEIL